MLIKLNQLVKLSVVLCFWSENIVTPNKSEHFAFDNADRLTSFKTGTLNATKNNIVTPTYLQGWTLDSIGNWSQFNDNGVNSVNTFTDTHEMTQFKGVTNTFDNNGNLTSDGVRTFKYDAFNRIIEVKIGSVILAQYQYDAFNRRVMKKVDADLNGSFETTVKFLYDGFRCIEELNASDSLTKEYVYGSLYIDEVLLQRTGATDYYFTHDYRYSVTSLTNSSGSIVESYDYKVYGERTASGSGLTDVGYTGQRHDVETGLMYFKNRYYSTSMGSFVTRDPLGYVDGMSMYLGYFGGQDVDPSGLDIIVFGDAGKEAGDPESKETKELYDTMNKRLVFREGEKLAHSVTGPKRDKNNNIVKGETETYITKYSQRNIKSINPELYDENKIMAITIAGGKANAFKVMIETIDKAYKANKDKDCDASNHIVVIGHGGREFDDKDAKWLLLGGERVEFDEFQREFIEKVKGKYNIKTLSVIACNIPATTASSWKTALGADVYYTTKTARANIGAIGPKFDRVSEKIGEKDVYKQDKEKKYTEENLLIPTYITTDYYKTKTWDPEGFHWMVNKEEFSLEKAK